MKQISAQTMRMSGCHNWFWNRRRRRVRSVCESKWSPFAPKRIVIYYFGVGCGIRFSSNEEGTQTHSFSRVQIEEQMTSRWGWKMSW